MKIRFKRADGVIAEDKIRGLFTYTEFLAPYADDRQVPAAVLTKHSWCRLSDIVWVEDGML